MGFERPLTIKEVINDIHRKSIFCRQFKESLYGRQIRLLLCSILS
ncbi:hypothetical protein NBRC111894_3518 [Sporolactobacillus inulinus]|uniref:Uncharacterized protein n=1 Tax=Sporolactobacillus inulinus TaxID=2078 RepID=A0A4Y1ZGB5_9BACL|nr:hypothetical protein [Sporolactobacillus inulinus]GAY77964.1 hypothetical protein NBRC111894_3518 [Sporolactobacillus inulinus]